MKAVHVIVVVPIVGALALAFAGQTKAAFGLFALSALVELVGSVISGKGKNI